MEKHYFSGNNNDTKQKQTESKLKFAHYNTMDASNEEELWKYLNDFLGKFGKGSVISQPFYCDIGSNISIGDNTFINYNCTMLDMDNIYIGDNVLIAPNVVLSTATHSKSAKERQNRAGYSMPIVIEDDVWIGANAVIFPGVTIGKGSIIGAGSVIRHDVPPYTIMAGNPAKKIGEAEE